MAMSYPVKNIVYDLAVPISGKPVGQFERTRLSFAEIVDMPFLLGGGDGFIFERLIADGYIADCKKETGGDFINSSGLFRQVLNLGEYGWYLAAIPPGTILNSLIVAPEDIAVDIFVNAESSGLVFGFYNSLTANVNITAKVVDDRHGIAAKIKGNPTDIELRNYFLKQSLAKATPSEIFEEKIPNLLTHDEASAYLGISPKTLYNWVSAENIKVTKVGKINKFRRRDLDEWIEQHTLVPRKSRRDSACLKTKNVTS